MEELFLAGARCDEQDEEAEQDEAENVGGQVEAAWGGTRLLIEAQTRGGGDERGGRDGLVECARVAGAAPPLVAVLCTLTTRALLHHFSLRFLVRE